VISSSQRPLPTQYTRNTREKHPCPQRDLNQRSQQSSGRRNTPKSARSLGSTEQDIGYSNKKLINPLYNTKRNAYRPKFHNFHAFPIYRFIPTTNKIRLLTLNFIPFCFLGFGNFVRPILGNGCIVHLYATLDRCSGGKTRSCSLGE